ncbi:tRNA (5-methylaminomethyl-2-thiouridine)(34)-methyltransferase MnmD [bacterium]|jgi:tRNA U34 5-methylaminomethyl-2-thiouridine-forming methyltransferase MnmC|nr:tRNA (5-methylaminomethyl-2-thiouridine)(34)-methyltransferase MnmD [bacterium]MBT4551451.1 tRNA (5-methylaminomethyl-2-thiouridine)(34)-methyltransferase MnmD [bacterium]MBT7088747.1 tRNA (5-methylaminomethyl-2-thiouridine)(34)-methyltransferase MnmD [bacterium]
MSNLELYITNDGSHTLINTDLRESYHSIYGAVQESQHVYIDNGLAAIHKNEITILEIGFGTGLNAYLSLAFARESKVKLNYFAIEKFPLPMDIVQKLNYPQILNLAPSDFLALHKNIWQQQIILDEFFNITKYPIGVEDFETNKKFDLVYFDAFAPNIQPDIWLESIFYKIAALLNPGGTLITYCAKGIVKRTLKKCGFQIESLPGPIGKREITRAVKL